MLSVRRPRGRADPVMKAYFDLVEGLTLLSGWVLLISVLVAIVRACWNVLRSFAGLAG
jgi:hypothetical protein